MVLNHCGWTIHRHWSRWDFNFPSRWGICGYPLVMVKREAVMLLLCPLWEIFLQLGSLARLAIQLLWEAHQHIAGWNDPFLNPILLLPSRSLIGVWAKRRKLKACTAVWSCLLGGGPCPLKHINIHWISRKREDGSILACHCHTEPQKSWTRVYTPVNTYLETQILRWRVLFPG